MFSSLQPHGLQYARLCPLLSPRVLRFMSIESVMLSNHLIFCYPLLLLSSIFLSIRVFSSESALHIRWPKYWSFQPQRSLKNQLVNSLRTPQTKTTTLCFIMILFILIPSFQVMLRACLQAMATHSSTLAWEVPWTEEPGRLQSMGLRRVGCD